MHNPIYRWSLLLQEFSFIITYRPGKYNVTADFPSRKDDINLRKPNEVLVALNHLKQKEGIYSQTAIVISQEEMIKLKEKVRNKTTYREYAMRENILIKICNRKNCM